MSETEAARAVRTLEVWFLDSLTLCLDGWCKTAAGVASDMEVSKEVVRAVAKGLRERGLIEHHVGLWSEEGHPAGSGWSITLAGKAFLEAALRAADAPTRTYHNDLTCGDGEPVTGGVKPITGGEG